jgi:hypothetical protein
VYIGGGDDLLRALLQCRVLRSSGVLKDFVALAPPPSVCERDAHLCVDHVADDDDVDGDDEQDDDNDCLIE